MFSTNRSKTHVTSFLELPYQMPWTEWIKQKFNKVVFSQYWRLDVQDQVGKSVSSEAYLLHFLMVSFSLPMHIPSVCVWVQSSSSYEDTGHIGLGLTLWPLFILVTSLKTPNIVMFWDARDSDVNILILGQHNSTHNIKKPHFTFRVFFFFLTC